LTETSSNDLRERPETLGRHENVIKRLTTFQTKLGNLNDLVVSEVKLRERRSLE
jgi:CHAD domain-containing protein